MTQDDSKVIIEYFDAKFDALLENIDTKIESHLKPVKKDISELKEDVKVIKKAVTATNRDIQLLDQRVTALEDAA
jgi:polyhydroxyalkanoate synthesis regulator phasin